MLIARRTLSFAAADLEDVDAIKTSVATVADAVSYSGAALNGAGTTPALFAGFPEVGAIPSVTTAANGGSYVAESTVTFNGTWQGKTVARVATLTDADGGETVLADGPLDAAPTSVDIEAQADTGGSIELGWSGVSPLFEANGHRRVWFFRCGATAGNVVVQYPTGNDTVAAAAGELYPAAVSAFLSTTGVAITVFEL